MKKIAILSYFSGKMNRGVESWAESVKSHVTSFQFDIISGNFAYNPFTWFGYDLIISTNGRLQVFLCRLFTWITKKKMVVFGHSGPGADDKWNLLCSPDVFVSFTNAQSQWVNRFKYPWTKSIVISHAVDTKVFTPGKKPKNPTILCVAANTASKRTHLIKSAHDRLPETDLLLVGPGQPEEFTFDQMPDVYKKASLFCFVPKPHEAFGLVLLEALSSNLPVVTIDDEVRREIVGEAGLYISDPENIEELSLIISKAIETEWTNRPRKQAEKFSWDVISKRYHDLCRELCLSLS